MSIDFILHAEQRGDQGKGASRRLRRAGKLPAIIYGAGKEPAAIMLAHNEVVRKLEDDAFYSQVLTVNMEDAAPEKVVLRDLQRHPAKPVILHMDFQRINENEAIRVHVPLHFINEHQCKGVKLGGSVSRMLVEVEVSCLPKYLPEYIEVDLLDVDQGETVRLSGLTVPEGVELVELAHGADHGVANVHKGYGDEMDESEESEEPGEGEQG